LLCDQIEDKFPSVKKVNPFYIDVESIMPWFCGTEDNYYPIFNLIHMNMQVVVCGNQMLFGESHPLWMHLLGTLRCLHDVKVYPPVFLQEKSWNCTNWWQAISTTSLTFQQVQIDFEHDRAVPAGFLVGRDPWT